MYISPNALLGGGEINQMLLAEHLDRNRYVPEVVVSADGPYADELRLRNIDVHVLPIKPIRVRSRRLPSPAAVLMLYRHIRRRRPAIVHSSSLPEDLHSSVAARLAGVPVIHDVQTMLYRSAPFDRWRASTSARVICISHAIRNSMARVRLPTHNTEVIYSGVDMAVHGRADGRAFRDEFALGNAPVVGIASRLSPEKGHDYFLRAAAALKERFPNALFLVVGGTTYAPRQYEMYLKDLCHALGLDKRVVFTGFRRDALSAIAAMDVLVCAADEEALGRVVLEAMALGKPVIATRAGGPCETVEDGVTGVLVRPKDARALAIAIANTLDNLESAREMGQRGRQRAAERYSIEQNVEKVQEVYRVVLARRLMGGGL